MKKISKGRGPIKKLGVAASALVLIFSFFVFNEDVAAAVERYGNVTVVQGKITIARNGSSIELSKGREMSDLFLGDVIRSSAHSEAAVEMEDGSQIMLGSNALLQINHWENGRTRGTLRALFGKFVAMTSKAVGKQLNIITSTAVCGIRGSTAVIEATPGFTMVTNVEGSIGIRYNNQKDFSIIPVGSSLVAFHHGKGRLFKPKVGSMSATGRGAKEKTTPGSGGTEEKTPPGSGGTEEKTAPGSGVTEEKTTPGSGGTEEKTAPGSGGTEEKTTTGSGSAEGKILPGSGGSEEKIPPSRSNIQFGLTRDVSPELASLGGIGIDVSSKEATSFANVNLENLNMQLKEIPISSSEEQFRPAENVTLVPEEIIPDVKPGESVEPLPETTDEQATPGSEGALPETAEATSDEQATLGGSNGSLSDTTGVTSDGQTISEGPLPETTGSTPDVPASPSMPTTIGTTGSPVNIDSIITSTQETMTEQARERGRVKTVYEK